MGSHRVHGGWHPPCCRERSRHKSEQRPRHLYRTRDKSCSLPLHVLSLSRWPNPEDERRGADPTRRIAFHALRTQRSATAASVGPGTPTNAVAAATPHGRSTLVPLHGDFDSFSFHPSHMEPDRGP